jgi:hypothetical protein
VLPALHIKVVASSARFVLKQKAQSYWRASWTMECLECFRMTLIEGLVEQYWGGALELVNLEATNKIYIDLPIVFL